jgi:putative ABC transport system permease protein
MSYVEIPLLRLAVSAVLILVAALLSRRARLGLEGDLLWGALRGAVQLVAVGYALLFLFRHQSPLLVAAMLTVMWLVAAATSARRVEHGPGLRVLFPRALVAIGAGALAALLPMFLWIVPLHPWYEAQYLVPIGGMMLGSAMNVVALTFERIFSAAHEGASQVEALLSLGATPKQALHRQVRATLRAALTPTINGLLTVGLVSLPGMMTGQIVSGTSPEQAVRYQIVILYQLVVVAAVAGIVSAMFARRLLFNSRAMLVLPSAPAARKRRSQPRRHA